MNGRLVTLVEACGMLLWDREVQGTLCCRAEEA